MRSAHNRCIRASLSLISKCFLADGFFLFLLPSWNSTFLLPSVVFFLFVRERAIIVNRLISQTELVVAFLPWLISCPFYCCREITLAQITIDTLRSLMYNRHNLRLVESHSLEPMNFGIPFMFIHQTSITNGVKWLLLFLFFLFCANALMFGHK